MFLSINNKIDNSGNYISINDKELNIIINMFRNNFQNNLFDKNELDLYVKLELFLNNIKIKNETININMNDFI